MSQFTVEHLKALLEQAAGQDADAPALTADTLDSSFGDLGYDSLAMLEVASLAQRQCGITLEDEAVSDADTPRKLLTLVNGLITADAA
ncbi:acyl carrier protein [Streptomyces phaeofaciens JCM 4814]|uniref:Actinorhodin polyketide synthase acyl carrier protein n=1 Tax=Streptomyces phaeofaciens TaxID=68254 RepID=A0A918H4J3_9ACTN|nr:acyl carrier protein [Streptomyces phaeofaciens]GGT36176.1 actinorhodin polyketide synthase acyl carrier protein [Streptomyces phaeofaciens]